MVAEIKEEAVGSMASQTSDPALARELIDEVDAQCEQMVRAEATKAAGGGSRTLGAKLAAPLEKSVAELDQLLPGG